MNDAQIETNLLTGLLSVWAIYANPLPEINFVPNDFRGSPFAPWTGGSSRKGALTERDSSGII